MKFKNNNLKKINPLISIIVPIYNGEKFISKCLDSILVQTYKNIEIICVVNGSSDSSEQEVLKYSQRDNRIKLLVSSFPDLGAASNLGLEKSNGKYISFVDADDWINSDYIEKLLIGIKKGYKVCKSNMTFFYGSDYKKAYSNKRQGEYSLKDISWMLPCRQAALYDKKLFKHVRFLENSYYEDLATWPLIIGQLNRIYYIDEEIYIYNRTNTNSIMNSNSSKHLVLDKVFQYIFLNKKIRMNPEINLLITALFIQSFWSSNVYLITDSYQDQMYLKRIKNVVQGNLIGYYYIVDKLNISSDKKKKMVEFYEK